MKRSFLRKTLHLISALAILIQSFTPYVLFMPAKSYAQEVVQQEVTPTPTVEQTPTPTEEAAPTPSPEVTPAEVSTTPIPTEIVEDIIPTIEENLITPTESQVNNLSPPTDNLQVEGDTTPTATQQPESPTGNEDLNVVVLGTFDTQNLSLTSANQTSSATLTTDKPDYAPTDTAFITGSNLLSNTDYVLRVWSDDEPATSSEVNVTSSENGTFTYAYQLDGIYRPNYSAELKDSSGTVVATVTFTDSPASGCQNDSAGANDETGQKDLTKMCADYGTLPTSFGVKWNWDDVSWSGQNTGDACALFDTDSDGNVNYALCVGVNGNPAVKAYTKLYSCNDTDSNNCKQSNLVSSSPGSSCTTSLQNTDPFSAGNAFPQDTESSCNILTSEVGGSTSRLIDVCSYPSGSPSSVASDCILFKSNAYKLTVTKTLVPSSDSGTFNLQIDGTTYATGGDGTITLTQGVSSGSNHTVGETGANSTLLSNYTSTVNCKDSHGTGNTVPTTGTNPWTINEEDISDDDDVLCTITNTRINNGSITIIKDAVPNDAQDFAFTAGGGLSPTTFNLDDDADGTLSNTRTFSNLASGTYSVSEGAVTGWTPTSATCTDGSPVSAIALAAGENVTCTFTNTLNQTHLTLVKTVTNDNGGTSSASAWTLSAAGPTPISGVTGSGAVTNALVTAGTYTLSESGGPSGYTASLYSCVKNNNSPVSGNSITLAPGDSATCTINNNDQAATLIVKKVVVNDNGGNKTASDFTFKVNNGSAVVFEADGQNDLTVNAGTYSVTEPSVSGYATSYNNCSNLVIPNGGTATCTITNDDNAPLLTLNKIVVNDNGGTAAESDWTLTATGPTTISGNGAAGSTDVVSSSTFSAGTYTLSESTGPSGYSASAWTCTNNVSVNGNNQITLGLGQSTVCSITNNDIAPKLHLRKVVTNNSGGSATVANFTLTANGTGSNDLTGTSPVDSDGTLKADTFALSETNPGGYSPSSWVCVGGTQDGSNIALGLSEEATCTITNDDQQAYIIVNKTVVNDNGGKAESNDFNLTVDRNAVLDEVAYPVNPGTHTAGETNLSGYSAGSWGGDCNENGSVTVALGQTKTCTITNNDRPGHLIVHKVTNPADDETIFSVSLSSDPSTGDKTQNLSTLSGVDYTVNAGTYSVTEAEKSGWDETENTCGEVTVANGATEHCTITNTKRGHIVVDKVTNPSGSNQSFDFTATGSGYNNFSLTDQATPNDQEVIPGSYSVSESTPNGWDLTSATCDQGETPQSLDVEAGEIVTCTFTNTQFGEISGYKYEDLDGDTITNEYLQNPVQGLLVELWKWVTSSFVDTGLTDTTDSSGFYSFTNLLPGLYQVREVLSSLGAAWTNLTSTSVDVELDAGEEEDGKNFINTLYGKIIVEKQTLPNGSQQSFDFDLSYGDGDADLADGQQDDSGNLLPGTYSVSENIPAGWDLTNVICNDGSDPSSIALASGETVTCTFTNTQRGHIIIIKNAIPNNAQDFTFNNNFGLGNPATFQLDDDGNNSNGLSNSYDATVLTGTYEVSEDPASGWQSPESTSCTNSSPVNAITVDPGETVTCTFVNEQLAKIILVKNTIGGNGTFDFDATGTGLPADIDLTTVNDTASQTFDGLDPDNTYTIAENVPAGWDLTSATCTGTNTPNSITPNAGEEITCTFENTKLGNITVIKYHDHNANGERDEGEETLNDWEIHLVSSDVNSYQWTGAQVAGQVTFSDLLPDYFTLSEQIKDGWYQSNISCGDETGIDNDNSHPVDLAAGQNVTCEIGNYQNSTIIVNKVLYQPDGVTVASNDDTSFNFNITDNGQFNQNFSLSNGQNTNPLYSVKPGNYDVTELTPNPDYEFIDCTAQYENESIGQTIAGGKNVTVDSGDTVTVTCNNKQKGGTITGDKFNDLNGNGRWDCEFNERLDNELVLVDESPICEPLLPDWTINLYTNDDNEPGDLVDSTTTDQNGNYLFANVIPGDYFICELQQNGWDQTYPDFDSDNPNCWEISVKSNGEYVEKDFGNHNKTPILTISKTNDAVGNKAPGDIVTFTITVTVDETGGPADNVKVTDLLPNSFHYNSGSWTASSVNHGTLNINEPTYASPGVWTLSDKNTGTPYVFQPGDVITLKYTATIGNTTASGTYYDNAWAQGTAVGDSTVRLANADPDVADGNIGDPNFVGTQVAIVNNPSITGEFSALKQVLGASILPATGENTLWVIMATVLSGLGLGSLLLGFKLRRKYER